MQIIPIASGKGGVGKSLLAANLAIAISQAGKNVVLADLDLGASNLHLALGMHRNKHGIGTFLTGSSKFSEIVLKTNYENLRFIPGDTEITGFATLGSEQKKRLIDKLFSLDADYLILDLGAGTYSGILDFFLLSAQGVLVTTPTVTAILDAYLFLKNIVFKIITSSYPKDSLGKAYITEIKNDANKMQKLYIPNLISELKQVDFENTEEVITTLNIFKPRVVLNMFEKPNDSEMIYKLRSSCKEYLGISLEHLGVIAKDSLQDIALASRLPVIIYKKNALISQGIYRIGKKIIDSKEYNFNEMTAIEFAEYSDDTFNLAGSEGERDYRSKLSYLEELVDSNTLSVNDLYEIIRSQNFEINSLKKQNMLLQSKIKKAIEKGFLT